MATMIASTLVSAGFTGVTAAGVGTALTAASVGLSVVQGISGAQQAKTAANFEAYKAGIEQVSVEAEAAQKSLSNVEALRTTLAQNRAAFAARGIDLAPGTAGRVQEQSMVNTNEALKIIRSNAAMRKASLEVDKNAAISIGRMRARSSLLSGFASAASTVANYSDRVASRGVVPTSTPPSGWNRSPF